MPFGEAVAWAKGHAAKWTFVPDGPHGSGHVLRFEIGEMAPVEVRGELTTDWGWMFVQAVEWAVEELRDTRRPDLGVAATERPAPLVITDRARGPERRRSRPLERERAGCVSGWVSPTLERSFDRDVRACRALASGGSRPHRRGSRASRRRDPGERAEQQTRGVRGAGTSACPRSNAREGNEPTRYFAPRCSRNSEARLSSTTTA